MYFAWNQPITDNAGRIERMMDLIKDLLSLEASYEGFVQGHQTQAIRIQPFLGMNEVLPSQPDLVKITPDRLEGVIDNYEEIRDLLTGTEFEEILYK